VAFFLVELYPNPTLPSAVHDKPQSIIYSGLAACGGIGPTPYLRVPVALTICVMPSPVRLAVADTQQTHGMQSFFGIGGYKCFCACICRGYHVIRRR
jgi:hypothetical protein